MEQWREMLLAPSFHLYQPNKVKQYNASNTYNKLIEPDKWESSSDLNNMTNLLKLLSSKNIKQKLGKDTQSMGNNGGARRLFVCCSLFNESHK
ncbi:MgPa adhesin [Mycoplasmoides genitalium M2288]|nr:MgPa adhesin [Mycoplasmoides genitalium M2288]